MSLKNSIVLFAGTSKAGQVLEKAKDCLFSAEARNLRHLRGHVRLSAAHQRGHACEETNLAGHQLLHLGKDVAQAMSW